MAITEAYMNAGDFSVALRTDTRQWMGVIQRGGFLVVTAQYLGDPRGFTDATLLGGARYTGIILETMWRNGVLTMFGAGQDWIWGDLDQVGYPSLTWSFSSDTLATVMDLDTGTGIIPRAFSVGTITNTGFSFTGSYTSADTRKLPLVDAMKACKAHYRINPDGSIDAGRLTQDDVYLADPVVVGVTHDWGSDALWTGIPIRDITTRESIREWDSTYEPKLRGLASNTFIVRADKNTTRTNPHALLEGVVEIHEIKTDYTQVDGANVGDNIYYFDPGSGFSGSVADIIWFRGQALQPAKHRIHEATWPIVEGMGVYYRPNDSNVTTDEWIDLTSTVKTTPARSAQMYLRSMDIDLTQANGG